MHLSAGLKRVLGIGVLLHAVMAIGTEVNASEAVAHWTMPVIAIPESDQMGGPSIFGTIALPVRPSPTSTRWSKLMRVSPVQPALAHLTVGASELPPEEQVAFVQAAVKQAVRTGQSSHDCSDDGYWAPASETLARGVGDCFDIAIAKMEALRFLGIPGKDLYLSTGYFRRSYGTDNYRESVALLVRIGEHFWLMTEQSEHIIEADCLFDNSTEFTPILTYGVGLTWVHGRLVDYASLNR